MKKVFIVHSKQLLNEALKHEKELRVDCYIPGRDTPQTHGDQILPANLKAMKECEEVHVFWDGGSLGTVFDMGMAFALGKPIKPVMLVEGRDWREYFRSKIGSTISN